MEQKQSPKPAAPLKTKPAAPAETKPPAPDLPDWMEGGKVNETAFCRMFEKKHPMVYYGDSFYGDNGKITDEGLLKDLIYRELEPYVRTGLSGKVQSLLDALRLVTHVLDFPPEEDVVHVTNGMLYFPDWRPKFVLRNFETPVRNRLPVWYEPEYPQPQPWIDFLHELLEPEDIMTLQEFMGYCLFPTNKAQKMLIIRGRGGEGKSQVGAVLRSLLGDAAKDGSINKVAENRFARADLENIHLLIDDDMDLSALKQTNYIKSLVTASGKVDLEKKGKQSYQGYMFCRFIGFTNGSLRALYDRSDGFYRRQLLLTAREKPMNRKDDPDLAKKLLEDKMGILLWCLEGFKRLYLNNWKFTESHQAKVNLMLSQAEGNNALPFFRSQGYIRLAPECAITNKELYALYLRWCSDNVAQPMQMRGLLDFLLNHQRDFGVKEDYHCHNAQGLRVRGLKGIGAAAS